MSSRYLPTAARGGSHELAISCGRLGAWATAALHGRRFTVQILDPRIDVRRWDAVVAPRHDGLAGDNVITTLGALNQVTPARLTVAALSRPEFAGVPAPRTAVLVGGSTHAQRIDAAYVESLVRFLRETHAADAGGFLVTTPRANRAPTASGQVAPPSDPRRSSQVRTRVRTCDGWKGLVR